MNRLLTKWNSLKTKLQPLLFINQHRNFIKRVLLDHTLYLRRKEDTCPPDAPSRIKEAYQLQREREEKMIQKATELAKKLFQ